MCYQSLPSGWLSFSVILFGFPLTSFYLAEASLSAFLLLYTLVCAVAQKVLQNVFY